MCAAARRPAGALTDRGHVGGRAKPAPRPGTGPGPADGPVNRPPRRRVLLTRTREDCAEWAAEIEALGAVPVVFPCIACEDVTTAALREQLAREVPRAQWLAFTSRRGVAALARLGRQHALPLDRIRVAAVGPATAAAARARLGRTDLTGTGGTAAALAAELVPRLAPDDRVLVAVAANAGPALEDALGAAGHPCVRAELYRTSPLPRPRHRLAASALGARNVFLASPSAVTGFCNQVRLDTTLAIFTIGPSTTGAARAAGLDVTREAPRPGLPGLMEALHCAN